MLKKHKNAFLETIKKEGLNPELFEAREIDDPRLLSILFGVHKTFIIGLKQSALIFKVSDNVPVDLFSGSFLRFPGGIKRFKDIPFKTVLEFFRSWVNNEVKAYLEEQDLPDLWSELANYKSVLEDTEFFRSDGGSDFSEKEKIEIRDSINKYKLLLEENFHPTKEQTEFINQQLDYLSGAVDRLNRIDWRGLTISILMGIAINLSVDTEKGKLIFSLFQQALQAATKLMQ